MSGPMQWMRVLDIIVIFISHAAAVLPFVRRLTRNELPSTSQFAVLSLILYYDLGLALELAGYPYQSQYLVPLLGADDGTFLLATLLLVAAPWLLHAGAVLMNPHSEGATGTPTTGLMPERRSAFYILTTLVVLPLVAYGVMLILQGVPIWETRTTVGSEWGPFIIILYLPLHFLAFYVTQRDSRGSRGLLICFALAAAVSLTTLVIGERTLVLLPLLILILFRFRLTLTRLVVVSGVMLLAAAIMLTVFEFSHSQNDLPTEQLISDTLSNDIARAPILRSALEMSEPLGTRTLPYPGSGYLYNVLFLVPRSLAPFKGVSTAHYITSSLAGTYPDETNWAIGVGFIEELLFNFGVLLTVPGIFVYGMAMGFLDRTARSVTALTIPTRLAAIWLCGYDFAAVLLTFGLMSLVGVALHFLFVHKRLSDDTARVASPQLQAKPEL